MIEVWHFPHDGTSVSSAILMGDADAIDTAWTSGRYVKVAECATDDLNVAYRVTNNIEDSWSLQPHAIVTVTAPLPPANGGRGGHRSSSVGDVFVRDGKTLYVATIGFEELK